VQRELRRNNVQPTRFANWLRKPYDAYPITLMPCTVVLPHQKLTDKHLGYLPSCCQAARLPVCTHMYKEILRSKDVGLRSSGDDDTLKQHFQICSSANCGPVGVPKQYAEPPSPISAVFANVP
jgi:hypothetical protein